MTIIMRRFAFATLCASVGVQLLLVSHAIAADQMILGKKFQIAVKDPYGEDPNVETTGKVLMTAKERNSPNTIVGDPVANGGSLRVIVNLGPMCPACPVPDGDATLEQTFALPAAGWSPLGTTGFKYSTAQAGSAVAQVIIEKNASSGFLVSALLRRADVTGLLQTALYSPFFPSSGGIVLTLGGGDDYCVGFGSLAGGGSSFRRGGKVPRSHHTAQAVLRMTNPTAEGCPAP